MSWAVPASLSSKQRERVLVWSSHWIYVPAAVWVVRYPSPVPAWHCAPLLLSGSASIAHWTRNATGDWRHVTDVVAAAFLALSLLCRLIAAKPFFLCVLLGGGFAIFFVLQWSLNKQHICRGWEAPMRHPPLSPVHDAPTNNADIVCQTMHGQSCGEGCEGRLRARQIHLWSGC